MKPLSPNPYKNYIRSRWNFCKPTRKQLFSDRRLFLNYCQLFPQPEDTRTVASLYLGYFPEAYRKHMKASLEKKGNIGHTLFKRIKKSLEKALLTWNTIKNFMISFIGRMEHHEPNNPDGKYKDKPICCQSDRKMYDTLKSSKYAMPFE